MSSEPHTLPPGELIAGRFRVIRALGTGGMGAVYEVEHELTKHRRALKLLHRSFVDMPEAVSRFLREASAAGRIGSRHIVETFDAAQLPGGEPYLVMELLRGQSLAERLEQAGRLSLAEALEVVRQAAVGIQAAHDAGIVHRDLKPENLFLVEGPEALVKILDFGISKFDPELTGTPSLTTDGSTLGTPYYMSPEQVRGSGPVDAQSDVYSLGVVLYECLTGKPPFVADTFPALCVLIHEGDYVPASKLRPDLPAAIDETIGRAMARDRSKRFASAGELARALESFGGGPLSLDETMAVSGSALTTRRVAPASARSIAPPPVGTEELGDTQLSHDVAATGSPRSAKPLLIGAGALFLLVAGVLVWRSSESTRNDHATREPVVEAPVPSASARPEPPLPVASAESTVDAAPTRAPKGSPPAQPSGKPRAPMTRAKEHGLGTEDPFGP